MYHCVSLYHENVENLLKGGLQSHFIIVSFYHFIIVSLYHCIIVSFYHCIIVSLYHCFIVSRKCWKCIKETVSVIPSDPQMAMPDLQTTIYNIKKNVGPQPALTLLQNNMIRLHYPFLSPLQLNLELLKLNIYEIKAKTHQISRYSGIQGQVYHLRVQD